MDIVLIGLLLGGTYALMAMGLQLQYGVARIMNLANGEILVAGAFGTFWFYTATQASPFLALIGIIPLAFAVNWLIYRYLILPLVKRARSEGQLEVDNILATFGLSFIFVGILLAVFGGNYLNYSYLAQPFFIFGQPYGLNRIAAFIAAAFLCIALYFFLHATRTGRALRAVAIDPTAAAIVGVDVVGASALAFALGGAVAAAGGALLSVFLTFDASLGVIFTLKALVIVIMGGVREIRGAIAASFLLGLTETAVATLIDPGLTLAAAYLLFLVVLLVKPEGLFGEMDVSSAETSNGLVAAAETAHPPWGMDSLTPAEIRNLCIAGAIFVFAAMVPVVTSGYLLTIGVSIVMYTVLATSWALFSGPTNYISLATAAFFGIGMYTVGGGLHLAPYPVLVVAAAGFGAILAAFVGLATLRVSGVYFVIFTLGLAELVRQLVSWGQHIMGRSGGLYVLLDMTDQRLYWILLVLAAVVFAVGWWIGRSRLGFALRIIGNDEVVAVHSGINTGRAKVVLFVISSTFASITGALVAPRWSYVEPTLAFSPFLSFQVVIMALLGGVHRLWGPLIGVIPFTILWEVISSKFPAQTTLLLGIAFLLIVYIIPHGFVGLVESLWHRWKRRHA